MQTQSPSVYTARQETHTLLNYTVYTDTEPSVYTARRHPRLTRRWTWRFGQQLVRAILWALRGLTGGSLVGSLWKTHKGTGLCVQGAATGAPEAHTRGSARGKDGQMVRGHRQKGRCLEGGWMDSQREAHGRWGDVRKLDREIGRYMTADRQTDRRSSGQRAAAWTVAQAPDPQMSTAGRPPPLRGS